MQRSRRRLLWQVPLIVLPAAAAVLALSVLLPRYVGDFGFAIVPLLVLGFAAVLALFLVPVHTLPAIALVAFALVPSRLLPQDGPFGALPLTTAVLVVWALRRLILSPPADSRRRRPGVIPPLRLAATAAATLFLLWAFAGLARSTDTQTSVGWMVSFTAGALLPFLILDARREAALVRSTWVTLAGLLGAYATLEGLLRANPVWGTLYSVLGLTSDQRWSTYRSEASFGHPLFAALFFAVACALGIGWWLKSGSRWTLVASIASGLGLVFTVSRGALLGGGIAVLTAYAVSLLLRGEKRWSRYGLLAGLGVAALIGLSQFDALNQRNNSTEAALSSGARDLGVWVAGRAAEYTDFLGSGPGTSGITGRLFDDVVIENSLLQLLISVGIPGLVLFVLVIGFAMLNSVARGAVGPAAGLLAYAICISGFNALDALRGMHLLLGCLLILALNPEEPDEAVLRRSERAGERALARSLARRSVGTPARSR